jgi:phosphatidylinositol phospholipase C delta
MSEAVSPVPVPLERGVPMLKISSKKMKQVIMRLSDGCITWAGTASSRGKLLVTDNPQTLADFLVPINQIRELRLGQPPNDAALTSSRWITIVYVRGKEWKILHMISLTDDVHDHWVGTLRTLVAETSDRTVAEIKPSDPDLIWIRQLWPAGSQAIDMGTAVGLCRSIGLVVPKELQQGYKVSCLLRTPHAAQADW